MSQTIQISDDLFMRISHTAQLRGLSIEQLLTDWQQRDDELWQREQVVDQIQKIHERLFTRSNEQSDSSPFIRSERLSR